VRDVIVDATGFGPRFVVDVNGSGMSGGGKKTPFGEEASVVVVSEIKPAAALG
jgi:hypothetical protein